MIGFKELFFGTFFSEDLACISAGILLKEEQISTYTAIIACTAGIFLGDLLLFLIGKFILNIFRLNSYLHTIIKVIDKIEIQETNIWKLIFLSRFLPGSRLPVYLAIGATSKNYFKSFFIYTGLACSIWTPLLIFLSYLYGDVMTYLLNYNNSVVSLMLLIVSFYLIYRSLLYISTKEKRKQIIDKFRKAFKLEFWPAWLFYIPIVMYIFRLILKYRGIRYITAANPGIVHSGIAGESKSDILAKLLPEYVSTFFIFDPINKEINFEKLDKWLNIYKIQFPIIIKPDVGERGAGVKQIQNYESLVNALSKVNVTYIVQQYSPGPYEAGIFYYRYPDKTKGKIFSVTDKIFPYIVGDGVHSLEWHIINHSRYKYQSNVFLTNHQFCLDRVIKKDEIFPLSFAGNHYQGCMFVDGSHLITDELESKMDEIAKCFKGFYFGRFDIRYKNEDLFKQGREFEIIELNGASSESTNVYDPKFSTFQTYSIMFKQWNILFEIGYHNYQKGEKISSWKEIIQMLKTHFKYKPNLNPLSEKL